MDLYPETWYIVRVRAYNDAGSSVAVLKFITTNYEGVHRKELNYLLLSL